MSAERLEVELYIGDTWYCPVRQHQNMMRNSYEHPWKQGRGGGEV